MDLGHSLWCLTAGLPPGAVRVRLVAEVEVLAHDLHRGHLPGLPAALGEVDVAEPARRAALPAARSPVRGLRFVASWKCVKCGSSTRGLFKCLKLLAGS